MLEFEPHINTKITAMLDQWANISAKGEVLDAYPWCHWLGFDIVCKSDRAVQPLQAFLGVIVNQSADHLLFDEDPGSVKYGRAHEVMPYFRAWKPTFIYVSALSPFMTGDHEHIYFVFVCASFTKVFNTDHAAFIRKNSYPN